MGFIWFWLVAVMIVAYVIFDGFDIGVGILHPFLARTEQEKQLTLRSIGPVWDGNEVWLLAGGGTLYFAFPLLYASAFSGFYLALMIVLWLLIMRGLGIELRMHLEIRVWRAFFDGLFFLSSLLLAIFYGAALANVIRGVPLGALALHGSLYLAVKTEEDLQKRARATGRVLSIFVLLLTIVSLPASIAARPDALEKYREYSVLFIVPIVVLLAIIGVSYFSRKEDDHKAFACSCLYLAFMLVGAAVALYPHLLPSSDNPSSDITIEKALSRPHTLHVGLIWWAFGMC